MASIQQRILVISLGVLFNAYYKDNIKLLVCATIVVIDYVCLIEEPVTPFNSKTFVVTACKSMEGNIKDTTFLNS